MQRILLIPLRLSKGADVLFVHTRFDKESLFGNVAANRPRTIKSRVLERVIPLISSQYKKLEDARPTSLVGKAYCKIFAVISVFLDRIYWGEWGYKSASLSMPSSRLTLKIELMSHRSLDNPSNALLAQIELTRSHTKPNLFQVYASLPLSILFFFIPGIPNIPLAYSLFRIYSISQAEAGMSFVERAVRERRVDTVASKAFDKFVDDLQMSIDESKEDPTSIKSEAREFCDEEFLSNIRRCVKYENAKRKPE